MSVAHFPKKYSTSATPFDDELKVVQLSGLACFYNKIKWLCMKIM
jgi:hypothetical protein